MGGERFSPRDQDKYNLEWVYVMYVPDRYLIKIKTTL